MRARLIGPSGPVVGTSRRIEQANTWRLPPHILAAVLHRHRSGSEAARRLLMTANERLLWQLATNHDTGQIEDYLVPGLWLTLYAAVDYYRDHSVEAKQLERSLWWILYRSLAPRHQCFKLRWSGDDLPHKLISGLPSRSTIRRRLKADPFYEPPRRVGSIDRRGHCTDTRTGTYTMLADHRQQPNIMLTLDVKRALDRASQKARDIAMKIMEGDSEREASDELTLSRYRVTIELESMASDLKDHDPRPPSRKKNSEGR